MNYQQRSILTSVVCAVVITSLFCLLFWWIALRNQNSELQDTTKPNAPLPVTGGLGS